MQQFFTYFDRIKHALSLSEKPADALALDDKNGDRGVVAPPADGMPDELPSSQIPGAIEPKVPTANAPKLCEMCTKAMAERVETQLCEMCSKAMADAQTFDPMAGYDKSLSDDPMSDELDIAMGDWDEDKHPRGEGGRWTTDGGADASVKDDKGSSWGQNSPEVTDKNMDAKPYKQPGSEGNPKSSGSSPASRARAETTARAATYASKGGTFNPDKINDSKNSFKRPFEMSELLTKYVAARIDRDEVALSELGDQIAAWEVPPSADEWKDAAASLSDRDVLGLPKVVALSEADTEALSAVERAQVEIAQVMGLPEHVMLSQGEMRRFAETQVTESKDHPPNPNKVTSPKGTAPAPSVAIGHFGGVGMAEPDPDESMSAALDEEIAMASMFTVMNRAGARTGGSPNGGGSGSWDESKHPREKDGKFGAGDGDDDDKIDDELAKMSRDSSWTHKIAKKIGLSDDDADEDMSTALDDATGGPSIPFDERHDDGDGDIDVALGDDFDESKHPRDKDGKFSGDGGGEKGDKDEKPKFGARREMTRDELDRTIGGDGLYGLAEDVEDGIEMDWLPQGDWAKMQKGLMKAKAARKREDKIAPHARVEAGQLPPTDLSKIGLDEALDAVMDDAE